MAVDSLTGLPDYMMQDQTPRQVKGSGNPILTSLAKGWLTQNKKNQAPGNPIAQALQKWKGGNPGTGLSIDTGVGVLDAAQAANAGTGLVSQASGGAGALDAVSSSGLGAGVSGANSAGGYLTNTGRALDTGFGDTGLGGGLRASDAGAGMQVSDANSIQYSAASDGGTGTATTGGAATDNSSAYLGAVTGALSGISAGEQNYYNDPDMTSKRDGFGTEHPDYRATVGGGTVGGLMGYYGNGYANGLIQPVVDWLHPGMEQFTRGLINTGQSITGDSTGAMLLDPIGTPASGKYSDEQIAEDKIRMSLFGGLGQYLK